MESLVPFLNKLIIRSGKIQIQNTPTRGRGIFATSSIKKYEKIFKSLPLAFWPSTHSMDLLKKSSTSSPSLSPSSSNSSFCYLCYTSDLNRICDECQQPQQPQAKNISHDLKKFNQNLLQNPLSTQSSFVNITAIVAYRIALELKSGYQNTFLTTHLLTFPILDSTNNEEFTKKYSINFEQLKYYLSTFGLESQYTSFLTLEWYLKMIGILNLNTIEIPENQSISGNALYDSISLFNHSCKPNITISFHGVEATVIALKDLSPNEELFLDYVGNDQELNSNDDKRYEYLNYNYGIQCRGVECSCGKFHS